MFKADGKEDVMKRLVWNLGNFHHSLTKIYLIHGVGLCSNIYVINWGKLTLIDTGDGSSLNKIKPKMEEIGLSMEDISQVILTHTHQDHIGGLKEILSYTRPKIFLHELELKNIEFSSQSCLIPVRDNYRINLDGRELKVLHTPGHTIGSICLYEKEHKILFSGDTIFPNGLFGRTDLPSGDEKALINSLERLSKINVNFLLPGHEFPVIGGADTHVQSSFKTALSFFSQYY